MLKKIALLALIATTVQLNAAGNGVDTPVNVDAGKKNVKEKENKGWDISGKCMTAAKATKTGAFYVAGKGADVAGIHNETTQTFNQTIEILSDEKTETVASIVNVVSRGVFAHQVFKTARAARKDGKDAAKKAFLNKKTGIAVAAAIVGFLMPKAKDYVYKK
ncbi:hypothetical protein JKY79_00985 [Candidatus Babeliales bacterium]|nr:hypothetical protein [Candidatus Babeliales bacterium]